MSYQFLNYLDGPAGSGKTTLLMEIVQATNGRGGSVVLVLPNMDLVAWFKEHIRAENSIKVLSAYEVRNARLRGLAPDLIAIDDAALFVGDIVSEVVEIVHWRGITPKIVVVR